jgi:hypothetical protein
MLSLWKLRVGVEAYYLAQISHGLDECYTSTGEANGTWIATGSATLALAGDVTGEDLRAVLPTLPSIELRGSEPPCQTTEP